MLDGLFIGLGLAAAGWFIARRLPRPRHSTAVTVTVPELAELASAVRYVAKSARGAIRPPSPAPKPPDPREAAMESWLLRQPPTLDPILREELQIAWRYACGIEQGTEADRKDAIVTLKLHGAPLPAELDATRRDT